MALTKVTGHVVQPDTNIQFHNTKSTGIITATDTTQSTSTTTGALQIAGGVGIAKNLNVGGNANISGVLTYEDVTNIDAVGIITAQAGIHFGIGATAGKFDALTGITTFSSSVGIADSIFHIGDTDTAIRFSAANTFRVDTGGSARLTVTDSTTTATGTILANAGVTITDNQYLNLGAANGADARIWHDNSGGGHTYFFSYHNAGVLKIADDTNVILGKTTNYNYINCTPTATELFAGGNKKLETTSSGATVSGALISSYGGINTRLGFVSGGAEGILETTTNHSLVLGVNSVEKFRILSDGRVGINTIDARFNNSSTITSNSFYHNDPKLGVWGSIVIGNLSGTATDERELAFYRRGGPTPGTSMSTHKMGRIAWYGSSNDTTLPDRAYSIDCVPNGGGWTAGANRRASITFNNHDSEVMRITSSGSIGIGTDSPGTRDTSGSVDIWTNHANTGPHFRVLNTHSTLGGGIQFKNNNQRGGIEFLNKDGANNGSFYHSTGGWTWGESLQLAAGKVLRIGKTSGSFALDVQTASDSTFRVTNSGETGHGSHDAKIVAGGSYYQNPNIVGSTIKFSTYNGSSEGERARITSGGVLCVGAVAADGDEFLRVKNKLLVMNTANLGDAFVKIKAGESGGSVLEFEADEGDDYADLWRIQNAGDGLLGFRTKASGSWVEKLRIDSSGRLLLGSTKTYSDATWYDDITINNSGGSGQTGGTGITLISSSNSWGSILFGDNNDNNIGAIKYDHNQNSMRFVVNTIDPALFIDSNGTVSIGSQAPTFSSPTPSLNIEKASTGSGPVISLYNSQSANAASTCDILVRQNYRDSNKIIFGRENANNWQASASSVASFTAFYTNNGSGISEKMRIDSTGRVLIGVQTQSISSNERFEVSGMSYFSNNSTGTGTIYVRNQQDNTSNVNSGAGAPFIIYTDGGGNRGGFFMNDSEQMGISSHGSLMFYQGNTAPANPTKPRGKLDGDGFAHVGFRTVWRRDHSISSSTATYTWDDVFHDINQAESSFMGNGAVYDIMMRSDNYRHFSLVYGTVIIGDIDNYGSSTNSWDWMITPTLNGVWTGGCGGQPISSVSNTSFNFAKGACSQSLTIALMRIDWPYNKGLLGTTYHQDT